MKVLVIGGGGREHAIVDALARSPRVVKIYCAPGNAGIAKQAELVPIKDSDIEELAAFAAEKGIGLTVVGPEAALDKGIVDTFRSRGLRIFGPDRKAAQIESSKEFAKRLMVKHGIPTAGYEAFEDYDAALEYVRAGSFPAVLKYDGLAAGKGVVIAQDFEEADAALKDMLLDDKFGRGRVVVEEYLEGPEFSFMCFVSGAQVYPMVLAQDHKRAYDGDQGPNTGGMGAYSPVPFVTAADEEYALEHIMRPTAAAMVKEGCPFCGVLYGGLIKTRDGIKVIEFNARFGDPETEVVLARLQSDICDIFCAIADGKPVGNIEWDERAALGIVMASRGYPGSYEKGFEIKGLDERDVAVGMAGTSCDAGCACETASESAAGVGVSATWSECNSEIRGHCAADSFVYHMGTASKDGRTVTSGGRVLFVVGRGDDLREARANALRRVAAIECDNLFYRKDIGWQAID